MVLSDTHRPPDLRYLAAGLAVQCDKAKEAQLGRESSRVHFLGSQKSPPTHSEPLSSVCCIVADLPIIDIIASYLRWYF